MSYKPIAPAPTSTTGSSTPGPGTPIPSATSVPSPSGSVPGAAAPFRPLFNDFGPPSMGYVQAMKPPGSQGSQSTYTDLLSVIEEMGKEIRPTYAGSKSAMERLKRGVWPPPLPLPCSQWGGLSQAPHKYVFSFPL
ncbi:cyclin-dependent kinase 2-associated protein 2 isoform X2 [Monodelphis domestica]|uniref:Cyclin dependent kinase 2 associated protein 2 n=1 Tax=Monodelphis domestica TaxID=13616 RepID=A0A5F8G896_MONDO|nr:cyclin-dependent kinase 2-associated protein 2 isoform X2 [Monodelphis domestica]